MCAWEIVWVVFVLLLEVGPRKTVYVLETETKADGLYFSVNA